MASIAEMLRRLFHRRGARSVDRERNLEPDRFARFRPLPQPGVPAAPLPTAPTTALEEDAYLLWQETEFFGQRPPHDLGETRQRPIGPHLWIVAGVAWLFTIDPVFRALTPRHFAGIPAPQLLAVLFVMPVLLFALIGLWARGLGPRARVRVRALALHWKTGLGIALALFWARSILG